MSIPHVYAKVPTQVALYMRSQTEAAGQPYMTFPTGFSVGDPIYKGDDYWLYATFAGYFPESDIEWAKVNVPGVEFLDYDPRVGPPVPEPTPEEPIV